MLVIEHDMPLITIGLRPDDLPRARRRRQPRARPTRSSAIPASSRRYLGGDIDVINRSGAHGRSQRGVAGSPARHRERSVRRDGMLRIGAVACWLLALAPVVPSTFGRAHVGRDARRRTGGGTRRRRCPCRAIRRDRRPDRARAHDRADGAGAADGARGRALRRQRRERRRPPSPPCATSSTARPAARSR